jgi:hypothetical protein
MANIEQLVRMRLNGGSGQPQPPPETASRYRFVAPQPALEQRPKEAATSPPPASPVTMKDKIALSAVEQRVTLRIITATVIRPVVTLYELEKEILASEGVTAFRELNLGPSIYHLDIARRLFKCSPCDDRTEQSPPPITSSQFMLFLVCDEHARTLVEEGGDAAALVDAFGRSRGFPRGRPCGIHVGNFPALVLMLQQDKTRFDSQLESIRRQLPTIADTTRQRFSAVATPTEPGVSHIAVAAAKPVPLVTVVTSSQGASSSGTIRRRGKPIETASEMLRSVPPASNSTHTDRSTTPNPQLMHAPSRPVAAERACAQPAQQQPSACAPEVTPMLADFGTSLVEMAQSALYTATDIPEDAKVPLLLEDLIRVCDASLVNVQVPHHIGFMIPRSALQCAFPNSVTAAVMKGNTSLRYNHSEGLTAATSAVLLWAQVMTAARYCVYATSAQTNTAASNPFANYWNQYIPSHRWFETLQQFTCRFFISIQGALHNKSSLIVDGEVCCLLRKQLAEYGDIIPCSHRFFNTSTNSVFYAVNESLLTQKFLSVLESNRTSGIFTISSDLDVDGKIGVEGILEAIGLRPLTKSIHTEVSYRIMSAQDSSELQNKIADAVPWVYALLKHRFAGYFQRVASDVSRWLRTLRVVVGEEPSAVHTLYLTSTSLKSGEGPSSSVFVRIPELRALYVAPQDTLHVASRCVAAHILGPYLATLFCPVRHEAVEKAVATLLSAILDSRNIAAAVDELARSSTLYRLLAAEVRKDNEASTADPWEVSRRMHSTHFHSTFPPGTDLTTNRSQLPGLPMNRYEPVPRANQRIADEYADNKRQRPDVNFATETVVQRRLAQPSPDETLLQNDPSENLQYVSAIDVAASVFTPGTALTAEETDIGEISTLLLPEEVTDQLDFISFGPATTSTSVAFENDGTSPTAPESQQYSRDAERLVYHIVKSAPPIRPLKAFEAFSVRWMNETEEQGTPYDIEVVILNRHTNMVVERHFIEVKATSTRDRKSFELSLRELIMAVEHRGRFSIYKVFKAKSVAAGFVPKVVRIMDPIGLWKQGKLALKAAIEAMPT